VSRRSRKALPPFGDIPAQFGHGALEDAAHSHGRCQRIDTARGHAADPGFLHDGHRGRLGGFAGLKEAGDIAALAQLRHFQGSACPNGYRERAFDTRSSRSCAGIPVRGVQHRSGRRHRFPRSAEEPPRQRREENRRRFAWPETRKSPCRFRHRGLRSVLVDVAKLPPDRTPRWPPGITPLRAQK